jgi:hypothetical protein
MGEERKVYRFWWENPKDRDHSEDKRRWEDGIRRDLKEIGWWGVCGVDLIGSG